MDGQKLQPPHADIELEISLISNYTSIFDISNSFLDTCIANSFLDISNYLLIMIII